MQSNHRSVRRGSVLAALLGLGVVVGALGIGSIPALAADSGQQVPIPYSFHDNFGGQWDVQADGCIRPGAVNVFDAGGRLTIAGNEQYSPGAQTVLFDAAHNELIFPPQVLDGLHVSRRICVDVKGGWCRWVEVLENTGGTAVKTQVHVNFDLGANVVSSQAMNDDRSHSARGLAVFDGNRGLAMLEAGHQSAVVPNIIPQQGNDQVDVTWQVEIPAKKTVAIVHLQAIRSDAAQAQSFLEKISDREVLHDLPAHLLKSIVNFPSHTVTFGDLELLRGDLLDVVELRDGDQYKGTIQETSFAVQTAYGRVVVPLEKVMAMLAVGDFRPSQLVITREGEAFSGTLLSKSVHMQLSSGQVTAIPAASIRRLGFHRQRGESDEFNYEHAMLLLRNGDRIAVEMPADPIPAATRYGNLQLKPQSIGALVFQGEESPVHQVLLVDGSRIAALVERETLLLRPISTGATGPQEFPLSSIARLQLSQKIDDPGDHAPVLALSTGDRLVGTLGGKLQIETAFDTIAIDGSEVRGLRRAGSAPGEMQVLLWDDTTVSGRLTGDTLDMALRSGPVLHVPAALLDEYSQPDPQPPASVLEKLRGLVADLGSDDWKRADRASTELGSMGPRITGALKVLRARQEKSVQDRIDKILKHFEPKVQAPPSRD